MGAIINEKKNFLSLLTILGLFLCPLTASALEDMGDDALTTPRQARGSKFFPEAPYLDFFSFARSIFDFGLHLTKSKIGIYNGKLSEIDAEVAAPLSKGYELYVRHTMNENGYKMYFSEYNEGANNYLFLLNTNYKDIVNCKIFITFFDEVEGNKRIKEVSDALGISSFTLPQETGKNLGQPVTLPDHFTFPDETFVSHLVTTLSNQNFGLTKYFGTEPLSITLPSGVSFRLSNRPEEYWKFRAPLKICLFSCKLDKKEFHPEECKKVGIFSPKDLPNMNRSPFRYSSEYVLRRTTPHHVRNHHCRYDFIVGENERPYTIPKDKESSGEEHFNSEGYYERFFLELGLETMGLSQENISGENDSLKIIPGDFKALSRVGDGQ